MVIYSDHKSHDTQRRDGLSADAATLAMLGRMQDTSSSRTPEKPVGKAPLLWRNTLPHRRMLAALVNQLDHALLVTESATRTLEDWSRHHALATNPAIRAERNPHAARPCPPHLCDHLNVSPTEAHRLLRYRHVRLMCGANVLSQADNWYRANLLSPNMNKDLETTDIPFGRIAAQLGFTRHAIATEPLWTPLPDGWKPPHTPENNEALLEIPPLLFRHQAVLRQMDGTPFSAVIETYTADLLRFAPPDCNAQ
ncbi:hypothetical protein [Acetobacter cibinongensis]|uniref:hypothetical protein n=1 Tax=Acetobacter cibinongensis TaxID=146475 RepID=UPI0013FD2732|nr:hypothetical protein [Acetobacter cibinongensis]